MNDVHLTAGASTDMPMFRRGDNILFQGDSITDGNRGRTSDPNHILGHGYVFIIAAKYGNEFPDRRLVFMNRGISGNTVADLQQRWQADTLDLKPDLLSVLIGVNDLNRGVPVDQYAEGYEQILTDTVRALPNVRLVLCEPFSLPVDKYKDGWEARLADLQKRHAVVEKLAAKHHAPVVRFQKALDKACERAPADYWLWDGVHPTYCGHQILADEWVRAVSEFWKNESAKPTNS